MLKKLGYIAPLLLLAGTVYAASTADITVTVTVRHLSVSVAPSSYAFGLVEAGSQTVASSAIVVTNDGNAAEDFGLKLTNPAVWTAVQSGTPGQDEFKLGAIYGTAAPGAGDYTDSEDFLSTSNVVPDADKFAVNASGAGEKGYNVAKTDSRNLWFFFYAPSSTTEGTDKSITTTVTASATP